MFSLRIPFELGEVMITGGADDAMKRHRVARDASVNVWGDKPATMSLRLDFTVQEGHGFFLPGKIYSVFASVGLRFNVICAEVIPGCRAGFSSDGPVDIKAHHTAMIPVGSIVDVLPPDEDAPLPRYVGAGMRMRVAGYEGFSRATGPRPVLYRLVSECGLVYHAYPYEVKLIEAGPGPVDDLSCDPRIEPLPDAAADLKEMLGLMEYMRGAYRNYEPLDYARTSIPVEVVRLGDTCKPDVIISNAKQTTP